MNKEILNKIADSVLDEPNKLDMSWWFTRDDASPCGTAACIAGWACAIQMNAATLTQAKDMTYATNASTSSNARKALKISEDQAVRLFHVEEWPKGFSELEYCSNDTTVEERADFAFWRIQHFIATEGRE